MRLPVVVEIAEHDRHGHWVHDDIPKAGSCEEFSERLGMQIGIRLPGSSAAAAGSSAVAACQRYPMKCRSPPKSQT